MSEDTRVQLGDIVELVRGTTYKSMLLGDEGPVLLGLGTIQRDGGFRGDKLKRYSGESKPRMLIKSGELYLSLKDVTQAGDLLGAVAAVPASVPIGRLTQDTVHLKFLDDSFPTRYLYWLLRSPQYRAHCRSCGMGTTNLSLSREDFLGYEVPKLNRVRHVIYSLLENCEEKIDLLHRQNQTLEAMAETLFRQWFVEEAEEGWIQRPLSSIANYLNGVACQKYPATDPVNRLPVLKIRELGAGITDASDWATSEIDPKYHVVAGDVIFSWSATLMVKIWNGPKAVLNQHLFKVTSEEFPKWFYYMWTKHHVDEFVSIAESHATTFGHIKRGDLDEAMVLVPGPERLHEMTLVMEPLFAKHVTNSAQIKSLTALRDTLLPKLMSGEVRVGS